MKYIFYNPSSHNGKNRDKIDALKNKLQEDVEMINVLEDDLYESKLKSLTEDDEVFLVGGDGTLNHFVNKINGKKPSYNVYFYSSGTGNDFYNDIKDKASDELVLINEYLENLPIVIVNDKKYYFIDGVGYGIDGYCCERGDIIQQRTNEPVNYTKIAIKGLLFHYKPPKAKVVVDGVEKNYKKVWLAPTMKGRFYGGGMMVAPNQNRMDIEHKVSTVVLYGSSKIKTLIVFPSIFKGEHIKHKKMVEVIEGHHIIVEFSKPQALQIDGETISNVLKYEVIA